MMDRLKTVYPLEVRFAGGGGYKDVGGGVIKGGYKDVIVSRT